MRGGPRQSFRRDFLFFLAGLRITVRLTVAVCPSAPRARMVAFTLSLRFFLRTLAALALSLATTGLVRPAGIVVRPLPSVRVLFLFLRAAAAA